MSFSISRSFSARNLSLDTEEAIFFLAPFVTFCSALIDNNRIVIKKSNNLVSLR